MNVKKKDKKKFSRRKLKLKNLEITEIDDFSDDEVIEEKRAEKKIEEKEKFSSKKNLKLVLGQVTEIQTNHLFNVRIRSEDHLCTLRGRLKQFNLSTGTPVAVGDFVNIDISGTPGIEEILPRKTKLSRFSDHSFQKEKIIASNIDQVIITASADEPMLNLGLIDRYICTAHIAEIEPVICINKIDLLSDISVLTEAMKYYSEQNIKIVYVSCILNMGFEKLHTVLKNKTSVFSGHSGVGKSSIINILKPELNLKVAEISFVHNKGVHTTTGSKMIQWDFGGNFIDTPGIKTFGLHRKSKEFIPKVFPGFHTYAVDCKYVDCTHTHEKDCRILEQLESGEIPEERYESYLRILDSL